ncbi:telomere-binding protein cav [Drosophila virilis]|uniref:Telomere-binding protein cav n=1 Tax=Drosophila virilis TaxID=7244 RepID=B4MBW7_DROVI|nr:telomere-binding protein cav [Drosophila virilis]EDW58588.1 uncharacterized protein Dvir_GJ14215 [Drosophila virilis]
MMARCLSELLIKYQHAEEAKILSIADELDGDDKELVRKLYEPLKITSEDLTREYTQDEKRKLCLRTKVRVNMTLFNCVWEAKRRLEKKGRLANRSERFINAMLVKAVAKKMVLPYTPDEIAKCNHIRQCQLKKENNCRLNRWHRESTQATVLPDSNESSSQLPAQMPDQAASSGEQKSSASASALQYPASLDSQNSASTLGIFTNNPEMWVMEESQDTVGKLEVEAHTENSSLHEYGPDADWAEAAVQINTESITIGTLDLDVQTPQTQSQPIVSTTEDYALFNTQVPATSTQTPCSEPFL